jgi:DNA-binding CsgD family transcriptional regulator/sugar-specific transcriptional regulator TrmB
MFEALNVGRDDERIYVTLVGRPELSPAELARELGLTVDQVTVALDRLERRKLVERKEGQGRFGPAPPDLAIMALVNEQQRGLDRALLAVPELLDSYRQAVARNDPASRIEVRVGPEGVHGEFTKNMAAAQSEVVIFDRDNKAGVRRYADEIEVGAPVLARGVAWRTIYDVDTVSDAERLETIRKLATLGEQSRVTPVLPMKMVIFDRRLALLPLAAAADADWSVAMLVVHTSRLLDGFINLFEDYWERSQPLSGALAAGPGELLSPTERETLELLCTGMKDEAIARQLGVSPRTLNRRILRLMTVLGVSSRFQAGIQAARLGLVLA